MRRKVVALSLVVFMLLTLLPMGVLATDITPGSDVKAKEKTVVFAVGQKNYKVGENLVQTDVAPYLKDLGDGGGRTMVPVAFVAPALGTDPAKWFPNDQMVLITKGKNQIVIFIGKKELLVNGKKVQMDVAAEIQDIGNGGGRTMLPIAFIARALEVGYEWDGASRSVYFYGYTKTYDKKGIFGPDKGSELIEGNVVIKTDSVTLQNMVIKGNLTIAEEVGDGDVTLNNITVQGETYIRGGGKDSIHINGGQYNNITVQNVNGQVRIVATDVTGAQVVISEDAKGEEIILEGNFEKVTVEAEGTIITTQGKTTINKIEIKEEAKETKVTLAKDTVVKEMDINSASDVRGQGKIEKADIKANDVNLGITPDKQNVSQGVTSPTRDNATAPGTPPPSSGGGGGGSSSPTPTEVAQTNLANKVAGKVSAVNGVSFNKANKTTTITILNGGKTKSIASLAGTGAMVALADIEEVRGYTIGGTTREFYVSETRRDSALLKVDIIADGMSALTGPPLILDHLINPTNQTFTVQVVGREGNVSFVDTYKFTFVSQ